MSHASRVSPNKTEPASEWLSNISAAAAIGSNQMNAERREILQPVGTQMNAVRAGVVSAFIRPATDRRSETPRDRASLCRTAFTPETTLEMSRAASMPADHAGKVAAKLYQFSRSFFTCRWPISTRELFSGGFKETG